MTAQPHAIFHLTSISCSVSRRFAAPKRQSRALSAGVRRCETGHYTPQPMPEYVYDFAHGSRDMRDLLGGKGANLAEMTSIGLPVPDGFIVTTEACLAYLRGGAGWPS